MKKKFVCMVLALSMSTAVLAGCTEKEVTINEADAVLEETVEREADEEDIISEETADNVLITEDRNLSNENMNEDYYEFAGQVFAANISDAENVMISPSSVIFAMNMAANGASGDTYSQMADIMFPGASKGDLNEYSKYLDESMTADGTLNIANSLWLNDLYFNDDGYKADGNYINSLNAYYNANVNILTFNNDACGEINGWVKENTHGMIPEIIDEMPADSIAYIINAMAFEGKWEDAYEDYQIEANGTFTNSKGQEESGKIMYSTENIYLENDVATGFIKYYEDNKYAFMAILPKDDSVSLSQFAEEFDGKTLMEFYNNRSEQEVSVLLPAFSFDYSVDLADTMMDMGVTAPFDGNVADFSDMVQGDNADFYINRILHKTHIELDEEGTRASAVTAMEMRVTSLRPEDEPMYVFLDRPFEFAIIDTETGVPVFMGAVNTIK